MKSRIRTWTISHPTLRAWLNAIVPLAVISVVAGIQTGWLVAAVVFFAVLVLWLGVEFPEIVNEAGPYVALAGGLASGIIFRHTAADREFYVLAAEVIPLLFLAMVAGRRFSLRDKDNPDRRVRVILIYFLILGEGYSLYVLAGEHKTANELGWPLAALVVSAILITTGAISDDDVGVNASDDEE
jgi:hypothetical protein